MQTQTLYWTIREAVEHENSEKPMNTSGFFLQVEADGKST